MLAKKFSESEIQPARPHGARPSPSTEAPASERLHLMLVREPKLNHRGLVWARSKLSFDAAHLQSMLRLERLNLG
jgi:hypothetical protein